MRRAQSSPLNISKQESAILIYELSIATIPYLEAIDTGNLSSLIEFVKNFKHNIDLSGPTFTAKFPAKDEIEKSFEIFFNYVQPTKSNGGMFKECYDKIENLYNVFSLLSMEK